MSFVWRKTGKYSQFCRVEELEELTDMPASFNATAMETMPAGGEAKNYSTLTIFSQGFTLFRMFRWALRKEMSEEPLDQYCLKIGSWLLNRSSSATAQLRRRSRWLSKITRAPRRPWATPRWGSVASTPSQQPTTWQFTTCTTRRTTLGSSSRPMRPSVKRMDVSTRRMSMVQLFPEFIRPSFGHERMKWFDST